MSELNLGPVEARNIKTSWSKLDKQQFFSKLYPNLLDQNRSLYQIFNNDDAVVRQHSEIFADCLTFIVAHIEEQALLEEFLFQFVNENQRFARTSVKYLDPMGNAFITTFKQVLNTQWTSVVELVWIKVYVFIANSILGFEEEVKSEVSSFNEADVPPLNIQRGLSHRVSVAESKPTTPRLDTHRPPPPPPVAAAAAAAMGSSLATPPRSPSTPPKMDYNVTPQSVRTNSSILNNYNSIEIDLKSNSKYKGFRRSQEIASSPIQVEIPKSESFQKVHSNISSNLKSMLLSSDSSNDDELDSLASPRRSAGGFDPRRKRSNSGSSLSTSERALPALAETPRKLVPQTPRSSRRIEDIGAIHHDEEEERDEFVTPRTSRRGSFSETYQATSIFTKLQNKKQNNLSSSLATYDEDNNKSDDSIEAAPYDPRSRKRADSNKVFLIPSPESSDVDEKEEEIFIKKQERRTPVAAPVIPPITTSVPEKRTNIITGTFDHQSFGLKGLAPIVEDDDRSSKYDSDGENKLTAKRSGSSSGDSSDSRTSSLSLHNSDYKSSINSSVGPSDAPLTSKGTAAISHQGHRQQQHLRTHSNASDDFQFNPPAPASPKRSGHKRNQSNISLNKSCSASVVSLQSSSRASLGFMRSSYVLKKEIEQQGFNHPENVVSMPNSPRLAPKTSMGSMKPPRQVYSMKSYSAVSLGGAGAGAVGNNMSRSTQSFVDAKEDTSEVGSIRRPSLPMHLAPQRASQSAAKTEKKGFMSRIASFFSSSKPSSPVTSPNQSSAPSRKQSLSMGSSQTGGVPYESTEPRSTHTYTSAPVHASKPATSCNASTMSHSKQGSSLFAAEAHPGSTQYATNLSSQTSTCASMGKPTSLFAGGANGRYKYGGSHHDLTSTYSADTTGTGLSTFFKKHNGTDVKFVPPPTKHTRKGNKYNVRKVPYNVFA
ncbi:uncharacterized protein LODBEIA_P04110 [Lodderomyces beijingensis]|uniref:Globin domain-containing protein n=1 Tax=Lodderomyces beijingensis TaxID=1775926 RepID=A0ABP0ZFF9_9ASCO